MSHLASESRVDSIHFWACSGQLSGAVVVTGPSSEHFNSPTDTSLILHGQDVVAFSVPRFEKISKEVPSFANSQPTFRPHSHASRYGFSENEFVNR
jgi:hypothetical protein